MTPNTFLIKALKKMFKVVGQTYSPEFCLQPEWYKKHTWNRKQEHQFRQWFLKNITKYLHLNKTQAKKEWWYFNLMWGWKKKSKLNISGEP